MPKKTAAKRAAAVPARRAVTVPATGSASMRCSIHKEDKELADAIQASRAFTLQNGSYETSLAHALEMSRSMAAAEAEEAKALRTAIEASMVQSEQKDLGLGLRDLGLGLKSISFGSVCSEIFTDRPLNCTSAAPSDRLASCQEAVGEAVVVESSRVHPDNIANIVATAACAEPVADVPAQPIAASPTVVTSSGHVLKVTYKQDTRRLRADWASAAPAQEAFASIRAAIEEVFSLPIDASVSSAYVLKYHDDEGDLCTLVENTVTDFLETGLRAKSLRIMVEDREAPTESEQLSETFEEEKWNPKLESLEDFSIATPPASPRGDPPSPGSQSIEDDYDSMWSLVEIEPEVDIDP